MLRNIQNADNLLSQTSVITNSYKRVEKATGENFNIFSILGIEHYEESTHSRFIAELLNQNGKHGYDNLFMIKFLELLNIESDFFCSSKYKVETEFFIGNVTDEKGGRIDILLTDDKHSQIMIENKIYANEQPNQLLRYHNHNKKGKLLYLTLYGSDSEQNFDKDKYINVSYSELIILWLEECQKIAVENPIVRETIRQYKNLIKKLTYQNINKKMNQEILSLIVGEGKKQNFESLINLVNLTNDIFKVAIHEHLYPTVVELMKKHDMSSTLDKDKLANKSYEWLGFNLQNEEMKKHNLQITFSFNVRRGANNLLLGFSYITKEDINKYNYEELIKNYENSFGGKREESNNCPAFQYFDKYRNWEDLNVLKEVIHGDFKNEFTIRVNTLLEIVKSSF
ncbi:MAG: PD-(D/E)XK nuclease family protein [Flavobacteriales bacterium]|nr:PD-(D/E)XK nuclease family protein [Flavobacteriales bacterium]